MKITLCGSTTFKDEFEKIQKELALLGHLVISVSCFGHCDSDPRITASKEMLDEIHKKKIDLSDAIFIVHSEYIGDSTRKEIEYAKCRGKKIFTSLLEVPRRLESC